MSFFFGLFGGKPKTVKPDYTGLQIQTAIGALPLPIVWGQAKLAPNIVWYNGFKSVPTGGSSGGKGGIFNSNSGSGGYSYSADVILALCEGPITGIGNIWKNQSTYTLTQLGTPLFLGTSPQTVWSYLNTTYPTQALAYQGTAYIAGQHYTLSSSATLDNHNFEVRGFFYGSGINRVDADPAHVVNDFLVNPQYGVGFPAASIDASTLFGSGGDASLQTYCAGVGIAISPALTNQENAAAILDRWLKLCNTAAVWSAGRLRFIPYGDTATVAGTVKSAATAFTVPAAGTFVTPVPTIYVVPPAAFVKDLGVVYSATGAALTYIGAVAPSSAGTYGLSPAGTYLFATGDENAGVTISYQYSVGASFKPNVTPIYNFGNDDFLVEPNADPVQVARTDPYKAYNVWRLEIAERANAYNSTPVESRDQNAIELFGMRVASSVSAHEVCDPAVALIAGQLMVQRSVYIRNAYKFRLSWECCLLDPMDLVTVTDTVLGLNNAAVRITDIEEDSNGYLQITAEEFPLGVASATLYATTGTTNNPLNRNLGVGSVNAPVIFEPTDELASRLVPGGGLMIAMAVSSSNVLYGGANVWMSYEEGGPYTQIGVAAQAIAGVTTSDLPTVPANLSGQTIDMFNTVGVNLAQSLGALAAGSAVDAIALNDSCYVGSEIVSYGTGALTGSYAYNLSYLVRGAYGTESNILDHPIGTQFAFINNSIFTYPYDKTRIGALVYFKFQSFNSFNAGQQSLADCVPYPYTITGAALASPLPSVTGLYSNYEAGFQKVFWTEITDFRSGVVYEIRQGQTWQSGLFIRTQAHPPFIAPGNGTFWVAARCQPAPGLIVYSETPVSLAISGNQLALNYSVSFDEQAANWPGIFDPGVIRAGVDLEYLLQLNATNVVAVSSGNTLTVTGLSPSVVYGFSVADVTHAGSIASGTTVVSVAASAIGVTGIDYGSVADAVGTSLDYGRVIDAVGTTLDYGLAATTVYTVTMSANVAGTVAFDDLLLFSGVPTTTVGHYEIPSGHWIESAYLANAAVNASATFTGVPVSSDFLGQANFLNNPDFLGASVTSYMNCWIEIATAPSISGGVPAWGAWQTFVPGVFPAEAWKLRLALSSTNVQAVPTALNFSYTVQFPLRTDHYLNQSIAAGGTAITFQPDGAGSPAAFNAGPSGGNAVAIQVDWQNSSGDTYVITNQTLSGFTLQFKNGGSGVARSGVTFIVQGT